MSVRIHLIQIRRGNPLESEVRSTLGSSTSGLIIQRMTELFYLKLLGDTTIVVVAIWHNFSGRGQRQPFY